MHYFSRHRKTSYFRGNKITIKKKNFINNNPLTPCPTYFSWYVPAGRHFNQHTYHIEGGLRLASSHLSPYTITEQESDVHCPEHAHQELTHRLHELLCWYHFGWSATYRSTGSLGADRTNYQSRHALMWWYHSEWPRTPITLFAKPVRRFYCQTFTVESTAPENTRPLDTARDVTLPWCRISVCVQIMLSMLQTLNDRS